MTGQLDEQQEQHQEQKNNSLTMATSNINNLDLQEFHEILHLLWGNDIRLDVFQRWSQGFVFSDIEPSALVQKQGGPCAVIAPVQAYLLKIVIMEMPGQQFKDLTKEKCHNLLIEALCNILINCRKPIFRLVTVRGGGGVGNKQTKVQKKLKTQNESILAAIAYSSNINVNINADGGASEASPGASEASPGASVASASASCSGITITASVSTNVGTVSIDVVTDEDSEMVDVSANSIPSSAPQQQPQAQSSGASKPVPVSYAAVPAADVAAVVADLDQGKPSAAGAASAAAIQEVGASKAASFIVDPDPDNKNVDINEYVGLFLTPDEFHDSLTTIHFDDIEAVKLFYKENLKQLTNDYGVLLFLYSVFLTKGLADVNTDLTDTSEPLIHNTFGYGAQALINLMLTGRAVAHVWDNDQDVGGLKLRGISEQSDIGFITLMEQLRYCTVGSFFKNPRFPVWVMGSDTHLTVLFSNEKRLVSPETPSELGRRVFKSFDPEGNNFIPASALQDVLATLNLVSDPAYVSLMQKRLDPENLGIILLNAFMDEFYHIEKQSTPDTFEVMHYNGIPGSNLNNKVRYYIGSAILLESDIKTIYTSNPIVTCLQTKWPNIDVSWQDSYMPSLN